jgi:hypothetical protein
VDLKKPRYTRHVLHVSVPSTGKHVPDMKASSMTTSSSEYDVLPSPNIFFGGSVLVSHIFSDVSGGRSAKGVSEYSVQETA